MKHLVELLKNVPKAAAIVGPDRHILECNDRFAALAGRAKGDKAPDRLADGPHRARMEKLLSNPRPGWRGAEITLKLSGQHTLCWCESHSLINHDRLLHFLEILDLEQFRTLEAAYLHQLRRVVDDNLWILDDDGALIWMRANGPEFEKLRGRDSRELVLAGDRPLWDATLARGKSNPGRTQEIRLRSALNGGTRFIDLCYLPGSIMGGRFYVASRSDTPSGSRVVLRLKEAWGVSTDTDLARRLGTNKSAVSRANDAESVPPAWLVKTGQATGFSLDWLLTGQGEKRRM